MVVLPIKSSIYDDLTTGLNILSREIALGVCLGNHMFDGNACAHGDILVLTGTVLQFGLNIMKHPALPRKADTLLHYVTFAKLATQNLNISVSNQN